jgi:hypothetical protein
VAALKLAYERNKSSLSASRRRAADEPISERLCRLSHELSVAVLADEDEHAFFSMVPQQW